MPDCDLGFVFSSICLEHKRACAKRTFALHMHRSWSLLTWLPVVPIPEFNFVFFSRLPAGIAFGGVLGRPALAQTVCLVVTLASSGERCEFRAAVGGRNLAAQVAQKRPECRYAGSDDAEVDLHDRPLDHRLRVGVGRKGGYCLNPYDLDNRNEEPEGKKQR